MLLVVVIIIVVVVVVVLLLLLLLSVVITCITQILGVLAELVEGGGVAASYEYCQ